MTTMAVQQKTKSCTVCGAVTAVQISQDDGATWDGPDNEERHAEYHARLTAAIAKLTARQDGIPPRRQVN